MPKSKRAKRKGAENADGNEPRGKRRAHGQRIGVKGEHLFAAWATDRGLAPNKVGEDYGVDYFCQVLRRAGLKSEEPNGSILAVQVRTTEGHTRPRVKLNREDAVSLLKQNHAACLVAIQPDLPNPARYLFIEETFIDRLAAFLGSSNKTFSIRLDEMEGDPSAFDQKLAYYSRPGVQHRLRLYKAHGQVAAAIPGSSVSVHQTPEGGLAIVNVPWIGSALVVEPSEREAVRSRFFDLGESPESLAGVRIRRELLPVLDLADGPTLLAGILEGRSSLMVESDGETATAVFDVRRLGDETAFTHPVGLRLLYSDRKKLGKRWVHELQARVFHGDLSLSNADDVRPFLRLLRKGAKLFRDGNSFIDADEWAGPLTAVGPSVKA